MAKPPMPLAMPSRNVLSVGSLPALQNCLKNTGKKPAITVVAKAEFAQSYRAQATTGRRNSGDGIAAILRHHAGARAAPRVSGGGGASATGRGQRHGHAPPARVLPAHSPTLAFTRASRSSTLAESLRKRSCN